MDVADCILSGSSPAWKQSRRSVAGKSATRKLASVSGMTVTRQLNHSCQTSECLVIQLELPGPHPSEQTYPLSRRHMCGTSLSAKPTTHQASSEDRLLRVSTDLSATTAEFEPCRGHLLFWGCRWRRWWCSGRCGFGGAFGRSGVAHEVIA